MTTALSGVAPEQLPEEMYVVVPERHAADSRICDISATVEVGDTVVPGQVVGSMHEMTLMTRDHRPIQYGGSFEARVEKVLLARDSGDRLLVLKPLARVAYPIVAPIGGFFTPDEGCRAGVALPARTRIAAAPRLVCVGEIRCPVRFVVVCILIGCTTQQTKEVVFVAEHGLVDAGDTVASYRLV